MTTSHRTTADPAVAPASNWTINVEVELQTALALARASTQALLNLSSLAHREISEALQNEVRDLEQRGDPLSLAAAEAIRPYLPRAA